ncbi:MAG: tyrosine-type recombinase/integrase [Planctomycetes bacterium]|nr:tyrosine-type recombinase/integrase [Planctomycetota bacterium]
MAPKIGRKKNRRTRTPHPGVKLKTRRLPSGTTLHVAVWREPEAGKPVKQWKERQESLDKPGLQTNAGVPVTNEETRVQWAIDKSLELQLLRRQIKQWETSPESKPKPKAAKRTSLEQAVKDYLDGLTRKAPKTVKLYKRALNHLTTWARKAGVDDVQDLDPAGVYSLSKYLHKLKARENVKGKGVGRKTRQTSSEPLAPASVNQFVRGIRTFLRHCRLADLTTLSSDDIRERLKFADKEGGDVKFLRAHEIRALLEACERHDAATYTRHRWKKGQTYPASTPFVVTCLLGGFRFSEAAGLKWSDFDPVSGEITLDKSATKTRKGRTVKLRESPALWALLERMALQRAGKAHIFGPMRRDLAESCRRRLIGRFGAPVFDWHTLRRTAGTFLTCAPNVYGAASAFLSAKRLGHSVTVAEKLYIGAVDDVSKEAETLEAAMQIDDLLPKRETTPVELVS